MTRRLAWSACFTSLTAATILAGWLLLSFAAPAHAWPKGGGGGGGPGGGGGDPPAALIPVKVILLAGQSNMEGGGGLIADLEAIDPDSIYLQPQPDVPAYWLGTWQDLQPGLNPSGDGFGPELTFGRVVADARPGDQIALIKIKPSGGNSLAENFNPDIPGASWVALVDQVSDALATLDPNVYDPEIVGMIWAQGNRDARFEDQALAYEANLANFIQAIRDQFGKPNLPFIIEQISNVDTTDFPYMSVVSQAQYNVWASTPNTGLFYSGDVAVGPDGGHFSAEGQLDFGTRFANEILAIPATSVDSVSYEIVTTRKKQNLVVSIQISDLEMGPVPFTSVSATLLHDSGATWDASGITDASGTAVLTLSNAPAGCFTTVVTDIGVLNWDPTTPFNEFCN